VAAVVKTVGEADIIAWMISGKVTPNDANSRTTQG
jgi:hypothetical protein